MDSAKKDGLASEFDNVSFIQEGSKTVAYAAGVDGENYQIAHLTKNGETAHHWGVIQMTGSTGIKDVSHQDREDGAQSVLKRCSGTVETTYQDIPLRASADEIVGELQDRGFIPPCVE